MPHGLKFNTHLSPVLMNDMQNKFVNQKSLHQPVEKLNFCTVTVPVVDYLYSSILLNPEFPQDDIVHATHWVCPRVHLFVSARKPQNQHCGERLTFTLFPRVRREVSSPTFNSGLLADHGDWKHGTTISIITGIMHILDVRS